MVFPARAGQTLDEAVGDRVGDVQHDDGDLGVGRLDRPDRLVLERHDEIDAVPDERLGGGPRGVFVNEVVPVEADILALLVPQRLQAVPQAVQGWRDMVYADMKEADPPHLPRLLGLGAERRSEEREDDESKQHDGAGQHHDTSVDL